MTNGQVLGFLGAPDRQNTLHAVSLALLKVRALEGMTREKLGKTIDCSADAISTASNEESLLSFDSVARLCYFFPDQCTTVFELWDHGREQPTVAERLARIEHELDAIRKETVGVIRERAA